MTRIWVQGEGGSGEWIETNRSAIKRTPGLGYSKNVEREERRKQSVSPIVIKKIKAEVAVPSSIKPGALGLQPPPPSVKKVVAKGTNVKTDRFSGAPRPVATGAQTAVVQPQDAGRMAMNRRELLDSYEMNQQIVPFTGVGSAIKKAITTALMLAGAKEVVESADDIMKPITQGLRGADMMYEAWRDLFENDNGYAGGNAVSDTVSHQRRVTAGGVPVALQPWRYGETRYRG